jgi:hypothetical protein
MKAKIIGHYSNFCFCEKPILKPVEGIEYRPRFEFAKAAKEFCRINNLHDFVINKRSTGRSASAVSAYACKHDNEQQVRIEWCLA